MNLIVGFFSVDVICLINIDERFNNWDKTKLTRIAVSMVGNLKFNSWSSIYLQQIH